MSMLKGERQEDTFFEGMGWMEENVSRETPFHPERILKRIILREAC